MALILEDAHDFIRVVQFPNATGEMVTLNEDGTYNLYLNSAYMRPDMIEHYMHGYVHMDNDDLHGEKDIMDIEPDLKRGA